MCCNRRHAARFTITCASRGALAFRGITYYVNIVLGLWLGLPSLPQRSKPVSAESQDFLSVICSLTRGASVTIILLDGSVQRVITHTLCYQELRIIACQLLKAGKWNRQS